MQKRDSKGKFIQTTSSWFTCKYCELHQKKRRYNQKYCNSSHQLKYEYENGLRDKKKIIKKAQETWKQKAKDQFKKKPKMFISKRGYWIIYIPGVGQVNYHHYVWNQNYGQIPEGFHIHHINLNKLDNKIENLQMIPKKEHHKLHDKLRKRNKLGRFT